MYSPNYYTRRIEISIWWNGHKDSMQPLNLRPAPISTLKPRQEIQDRMSITCSQTSGSKHFQNNTVSKIWLSKESGSVIWAELAQVEVSGVVRFAHHLHVPLRMPRKHSAPDEWSQAQGPILQDRAVSLKPSPKPCSHCGLERAKHRCIMHCTARLPSDKFMQLSF